MSTITRSAMSPMCSGVRAYFAPVSRTAGTTAEFDLALCTEFDVDAPPSPWIDLGWVRNLKRTSGTAVQQLRRGEQGAVKEQFRSQLSATVELEFMQWGKLQMALSGGGQHMNVLARVEDDSHVGTRVEPAVPLLAGSSAAELVVGESNVGRFTVGDIVAVDLDYRGQRGYVGSGVSGAWAEPERISDVDYIRRVTFNVGRVVSRSTSRITLAQPLIGGVPPSGSGVQRVVGFTDREGDGFLQEWSALFVMADEGGSRLFFYYPRLQVASRTEAESVVQIADDLSAPVLSAKFNGLPVTDVYDRQTVLCYRSYLPAVNAAVY